MTSQEWTDESVTQTCRQCAAGNRRVRETLPNGEVIWAHWDGGVCQECKGDEPTKDTQISLLQTEISILKTALTRIAEMVSVEGSISDAALIIAKDALRKIGVRLPKKKSA